MEKRWERRREEKERKKGKREKGKVGKGKKTKMKQEKKKERQWKSLPEVNNKSSLSSRLQNREAGRPELSLLC